MFNSDTMLPTILSILKCSIKRWLINCVLPTTAHRRDSKISEIIDSVGLRLLFLKARKQKMTKYGQLSNEKYGL